MKSLKELFSSAMSELILDEKKEEPVQAKEEQIQKFQTISEQKMDGNSLSDFDRILEMLESENTASRNKGIRSLENLSEDNRLLCIAIFSRNAEARMAALDRISKNPELLSTVYSESKFRDTSEAAMQKLVAMMERLKSQRALALIAGNHPDRDKRMRALRQIKEANALLEVAYNSRFEDGRWEAIGSLKDLKIDIGQDDLRHDDTLMSLADQLVKSSTSEEEIIEDMGIILENVKYLQGMKKGDEFGGIVADNLSAYRRILRGIATSSKHPQARALAIKGMSSDTDMLAEIAQHSEYEDSAQLAVEMIASGIGQADPQALALVASMSSDGEKRSKAITRLKDEQMLKHVCKFSRYEDSRMAAAHKLAAIVEKIDDPESLRLVLTYAKESKNRALAERRIDEITNKAPKELPKIEITARSEPAKVMEVPEKAPEPAQERKSEPQPAGGGLLAMLKELIGI
ncbi:MAG TPA: hypothetical protein VLD37_03920 [Candidatus Bilamarchaeum sp.]|nr:hypothetical protein [Candidatus Bilamarchaeum sp.]